MDEFWMNSASRKTGGTEIDRIQKFMEVAYRIKKKKKKKKKKEKYIFNYRQEIR